MPSHLSTLSTSLLLSFFLSNSYVSIRIRSPLFSIYSSTPLKSAQLPFPQSSTSPFTSFHIPSPLPVPISLQILTSYPSIFPRLNHVIRRPFASMRIYIPPQRSFHKNLSDAYNPCTVLITSLSFSFPLFLFEGRFFYRILSHANPCTVLITSLFFRICVSEDASTRNYLMHVIMRNLTCQFFFLLFLFLF